MQDGIEFFLFFIAVLFSLIIFFLWKRSGEKEDQLETLKKMLVDIANNVSVFERERISKDLHDEIGAKLSILNLNLTKVSRNIDNKGLCEVLAKENLQITNDAIQNIRKISKNLMSPGLSYSEFKNSLQSLCRQINVSRQIELELILFPDSIQVGEYVMQELFRIIQEAINNIIKHAFAKKITIAVYTEDKKVEIILTHNGNVFNDDIKQKVINDGAGGNGFINMQSRAGLINANITYSSSEKESKTIITLLP